MPSFAWIFWKANRSAALSEFEVIHRKIGKTGPGTKHARQQVNQAYLLMLSGQFQGFCRDLHSECVDHLATCVQPPSVRAMLTAEFHFGRKLDTGNPNPGNIGNDFNRFGFDFWSALLAHDPRLKAQQDDLRAVNDWRNAIAHQSFDPVKLGGSTSLRHSQIKAWRKSCDVLADAFDDVVANQLFVITGIKPW
jgi:hypothetical protein